MSFHFLLFACPLTIFASPGAQVVETPGLRGAKNFQACPGCRQCAAESEQCSDNFPCCDSDSRCESILGGNGAQCVQQHPAECAAEHEECSDGVSCCDPDARCESIVGGTGAQCVKQHPAECAAEHDQCNDGVPCCDLEARCESVIPGAAAQCTKEQSPPAGNLYEWAQDDNFCLSVVDNKFQNGQKIQMWQCATGDIDSSGQRFERSADGYLRVAAHPEYCVVVDGNSDDDGAAIQLWLCGNEAVQQWDAPGCGIQCPNTPLINHVNRKCLVVDNNNAYNGAKVQLWTCDGNTNQMWWIGD